MYDKLTQNSINICTSQQCIKEDGWEKIVHSLSDIKNSGLTMGNAKSDLINDLLTNKSHVSYLKGCAKIHSDIGQFIEEHGFCYDLFEYIDSKHKLGLRTKHKIQMVESFGTCHGSTSQGRQDINSFMKMINDQVKLNHFFSPIAIDSHVFDYGRKKEFYDSLEIYDEKMVNVLSTTHKLSVDDATDVYNKISCLFFEYSYKQRRSFANRRDRVLKKLNPIRDIIINNSFSHSQKRLWQNINVDKVNSWDDLKILLDTQFERCASKLCSLKKLGSAVTKFDMSCCSTMPTNQQLNVYNDNILGINSLGKMEYQFSRICTHLQNNELIKVMKSVILFFHNPTSYFNMKLNIKLRPIEIITCIVQNFHLLHPYDDGNGRSIVFGLQNSLLAKYGYPYTMHYYSGRAVGLGGIIPSSNSEYAKEVAFGCAIRRWYDSIESETIRIDFLKLATFIWQNSPAGDPFFSVKMFEDILKNPRNFCRSHFKVSNISQVTQLSNLSVYDKAKKGDAASIFNKYKNTKSNVIAYIEAHRHTNKYKLLFKPMTSFG
ncbi:MAG: hypothetical protein GY750_04430 [Lentisphaerae bacterium]|nr:hypothetical protein [Lentisphaerota bacterium]MCP4100658.1 hypothetical protein [Lentisphaerota bacterium]